MPTRTCLCFIEEPKLYPYPSMRIGYKHMQFEYLNCRQISAQKIGYRTAGRVGNAYTVKTIIYCHVDVSTSLTSYIVHGCSPLHFSRITPTTPLLLVGSSLLCPQQLALGSFIPSSPYKEGEKEGNKKDKTTFWATYGHTPLFRP